MALIQERSSLGEEKEAILTRSVVWMNSRVSKFSLKLAESKNRGNERTEGSA